VNVNDTEILNAIMLKSGYERTLNMEEANVVFLVTVSHPPEKKVRHSTYLLHLVCDQRKRRNQDLGKIEVSSSLPNETQLGNASLDRGFRGKKHKVWSNKTIAALLRMGCINKIHISI
jgi:hypothetical protein